MLHAVGRMSVEGRSARRGHRTVRHRRDGSFPWGAGVNVYLSFDIEMWLDGWIDLDRKFAAGFQRYYYGRSAAGDYALPKTLEILNRHGLTGVFFVEPLFSARFGARHLDEVTGLIAAAGQDIQLHLHPEWTDEIRPALLPDVSCKRQHLSHYSLQEQTTLIGVGRNLLQVSTGRPVTAFRAGSFAANRDTYRALCANGITVDSSLHAAYDFSAGSIQDIGRCDSLRVIDGVATYRVTVIQDGFGRQRPAHVAACSDGELRAALFDAAAHGVRHFVIVSHNFELLKPGSSQPEPVLVRRFDRICRFLAEHRDLFRVGPYPLSAPGTAAPPPEPQPVAGALATAWRHVEQLACRLPARTPRRVAA